MINVEKRTTKSNIPNKAFDLEYSTQFKKQMLYLKQHGFECSFIKKSKDYGIPTYKYTKSPALFRAIADFYEQLNYEKQFSQLQKIMDFATDYTEFNERSPIKVFGVNSDDKSKQIEVVIANG